jgi:hypothetical protein
VPSAWLVFLRALPVKGVDGIRPEDAELDPATGHVFAKNGLTGALNSNDQLEVQAMAPAGYVIAGDRRLAFNVVANHIPIINTNRPMQVPTSVHQRRFASVRAGSATGRATSQS